MRALVYNVATGAPRCVVTVHTLEELVAAVWDGEDHLFMDGRDAPADWAAVRVQDGELVALLPSLEDVRTQLLEAAKAERDRRVFGGFAWDGSVFDSDQTSQARILGCYVSSQASPESFPRQWRLADNSWRSVSVGDAEPLFLALGAHLQSHFDAFAAHESAISAASAEVLDAYDVATGWPG